MRGRRGARRVAPVACLVAGVLGGCGTDGIIGSFTNKGCDPGATVFIVPDVSRSTAPQRAVGGEYERQMLGALKAAARDCAEAVYSAPADGNAIGHGAWVIDGKRFREQIGGNEGLSRAARAEAAGKLLPDVRRVLRMSQAAGSDVLGSALRISLAMKHVAARSPVQIVWLTDGALNVAGGYSVYTTPIDTPARRRRFIARLAALGELPDFGGRADVYVGGLGLGLKRTKARDVIALWKLLVPSMHARLRSADATLRFP